MGPNGVIEGIQPGSLFIDMSTIDPSVARKLHAAFAERGVEALDAPVSGGQIGAEQATLSIMVGGSEAAFQRALPIFQAMGKNIVHVGGPGAGQVTKACNQVVVALTIQAVAEALLLAEKAGSTRHGCGKHSLEDLPIAECLKCMASGCWRVLLRQGSGLGCTGKTCGLPRTWRGSSRCLSWQRSRWRHSSTVCWRVDSASTITRRWHWSIEHSRAMPKCCLERAGFQSAEDARSGVLLKS